LPFLKLKMILFLPKNKGGGWPLLKILGGGLITPIPTLCLCRIPIAFQTFLLNKQNKNLLIFFCLDQTR
jgi:hypothetical protein